MDRVEQRRVEKQDKAKPPARPSGLILLPFLILVGLWGAPPTRTFLQTQLRLLHDAAPFLARLREMGVQERPPVPAQAWKQSATAVGVARFPKDYTIQVGGALLAASYRPSRIGGPLSSQESYESFQDRYGAKLAAVSAHFPGRPGPYAHMLRYMTGSTVRVSRTVEIELFQTGNTPAFGSDRSIGNRQSWAAFDHAAARGEKLDPDNAYFPMMRAIGLFDAKRDAEGVAAVLRAAQKSRFEDYASEEQDAEWALYLRSYGPTSTLVHQSISISLLLPHFSSLRQVGRVMAYQAEKAERAGRTQEGLALRHAAMRCGVLMREQSSIIGALVGTSIISSQATGPGGAPVVAPSADLSNEDKIAERSDLYLDYLHKIGAEEEARWFTVQEDRNREVRALVAGANREHRLEGAVRLPALWTLDMLLLANTLTMLLLCTAAAVCARIPGGEKALPGVVVILLVGCLVAALPLQWAEGLTQIRMVLDSMNDNSGQRPDTVVISGVMTRFPGVIHVGEVILSLLLPALTLLVLGLVGMIRRETFTRALTRGLQRGALIVATLLTVAYAGALIATAQAERQADSTINGVMSNGIASLQQRRERGHRP
ncbi:MAG: hypothetical protein JWN14_1721 [Chthonomonadales bacterium]|nr:hypothetical protein [Chthonomonadales bacterium]